MNKIRCAIYARKSSEEGLEQDFNSLHAQREACAAYILSQASEGWSLRPEDYDDGGLSGGTLERPALQRLLADMEAGKIDIVVVYKVDRLTRSLLDFSKLVETMDKARERPPARGAPDVRGCTGSAANIENRTPDWGREVQPRPGLRDPLQPGLPRQGTAQGVYLRRNSSGHHRPRSLGRGAGPAEG